MSQVKQKKIVMLLPHVGEGGDWSVVKNMITCLVVDGHKVFVASNGQKPIGLEETVDWIHITLNKGEVNLGQVWQARHQFPSDVDILHAHSPVMLTFALFLKKTRCQRSLLVMTYHWQTPDSFPRQFYKTWLFDQAKKIHVCSSEILQVLSDKYHCPQDKLHLFYIGVDQQRFYPATAPERNRLRSNLKIAVDDLALCFVGRLNPEKQVDWILRYLAERKGKLPQVKLIIAGDGPCRKLLEQQVMAYGIGSQVQFLGKVAEPRTVYAACDALLLPSTSWETFGLVVVEAALCGTPTLRSNTPGARDQIEDKVSGFIFDVNHPNDYADKMDMLLAQTLQELKIMGKSARQTALQKFQMSHMQVGLRKLYHLA